jgi:hypothetical protein
MLLRALIATAALWIFAITAAMGYVAFRIYDDFTIVSYVMSHFI